jgi:N-methylhydantoinase A
VSYQIAVDVGGTFTDLVLQDAAGRVQTFKSPTTPGRVVDGILDGLALIASHLRIDRSALLADCAKLACGTTAATNAILEGTYARTALICTEGFRDTLLIREGGKQDTYQIAIDYPPAYIPRHLTFCARERINSEGGIEHALDEEHLGSVLEEIRAREVEAVAVALLWSIANPVHERRIGELIEAQCPGLPYSLSHQTSPTLREYRRTSAAAIDASLKPLAQRAVTEMEERLRQAGLSGVLTLVTSSGGQTGSEEVIRRPIHLCLSGPSAAPEAARQLVEREGDESGNAIVVDMGGTSFDTSIIHGWQIPLHREGVIAGQVFGVPSVEVKTIGAGGGSIAWVDAGGFIHVGPESARSLPGPACYGRGGTRPTVTDANLVRGLLDPESFAGGTMRLLPERAEAAIREHVAEPLGMPTLEAASLIALTVEQNMVAAIEDITLRQGIDPRDYCMVAGGAAAGMHAVPIARELGIRRLLVPPVAGVLSAFGILVSDIKSGFSRGFTTTSERFDFAGVAETLSQLDAEASAYLDRMSVPAERRELRFSVEARYRGQVWQLAVPVPDHGIPDDAALANLVEAFHRTHERLYFVRSADRVEFTEWNVLAIGHLQRREPDHGFGAATSGSTRKGHRKVHLRELGTIGELPIFDGTQLRPGATIEGPAIIDQPLTSILLHPQTTARFSAAGGVWVDLH